VKLGCKYHRSTPGIPSIVSTLKGRFRLKLNIVFGNGQYISTLSSFYIHEISTWQGDTKIELSIVVENASRDPAINMKVSRDMDETSPRPQPRIWAYHQPFCRNRLQIQVCCDQRRKSCPSTAAMNFQSSTCRWTEGAVSSMPTPLQKNVYYCRLVLISFFAVFLLILYL